MDLVAKSAPDGHTWAVGNSGTHSVNPALYKKLSYDPLRDFIAVSQFSTTGMVVAGSPRLPGGSSINDLVAYAKKLPGRTNIAIPGATGELAGDALWSQLQLKMTNVPYSGSAPAMLAVMAGEADIALLTPLAVQTHVQSGKLKAYGITSKERSPVLPDVPTLAEQGVTGYDFPYWNGLFVAAGTPDKLVRTDSSRGAGGTRRAGREGALQAARARCPSAIRRRSFASWSSATSRSAARSSRSPAFRSCKHRPQKLQSEKRKR